MKRNLTLLVLVASLLAAAPGHAATRPDGLLATTVPVGQSASVGGGWTLRVLHTTRNAVSYAGGYRDRLPSGVTVVMATIRVEYKGHGRGSLRALGLRAYVTAIADYTYAADEGAAGCGPAPGAAESTSAMRATLTSGDKKVGHGRSRTGRLCFEVPPAQAKHLRLYFDPPGCSTLVSDNCDRVWFALH